MPVTLLNTPILTAYGRFSYQPLSLSDAKEMVKQGHLSAIGHQATADVLSELLGVSVAVNRINYLQEVGEIAIVFKLRDRIEEGKILSREEIDKIGYDLGLLVRAS